MKKLFCFLTTSLLLFSCSNDDQVNSNKLDQKSENSIQRIKTQFNKEYKLIPNHEKFKNVDWNNPKVFTYGDNKKGISLKTYNSKNENEFNLLIGYNKQGEEYYFLSTDKPQELSTKDIVMTYNDKTVVYTQEIYGNESNNKDLNFKKSVRSTDTGLISGNDPGEELPGVYMYIRPGLSSYYNPGRTGNYLDYDSMKELDNWNRGGGGGGGSTAVTSPAPEDKIIIDKTFEDNKCVKDIYDKLGGTEIGKRFIDPFKLNTGISLSYKIEYYNRESHGYTISVPKKSHQYQIAINGNYLQRSKVDIAKTIIHETIHANILAYLHSKSIGFATDNPEFSEIWDTYTDLTLQEKALIKKEGNDSFHHEYMAEKYIEVLVMGMKQYLGNSNNFTDAELGAFAWGGLMGTKIYKSLPSREKSSILTNYERAKTKGERNSCY